MAVTRARGQFDALVLTHTYKRRSRKRMKYALALMEFFANRNTLPAPDTRGVMILNLIASVPTLWDQGAQQGVPRGKMRTREG